MIPTAPLAYDADLALLVVRIVMGATMLFYGWPKIKDLSATAKDFDAMGLKPGWLLGTTGALIEFFGGLAILTGVFLPIAAIAHGGMMAFGTLWKVSKTNKPFTDWSYDLLMMSVDILLLVTGAGSFVLLGL